MDFLDIISSTIFIILLFYLSFVELSIYDLFTDPNKKIYNPDNYYVNTWPLLSNKELTKVTIDGSTVKIGSIVYNKSDVDLWVPIVKYNYTIF